MDENLISKMMKKQLILSITALMWGTILLAQETRLIVPLGHTRRIVDMKVSANDQWLASIDGSELVKIWQYDSRKETYHLPHKNPVAAIAYHPQLIQLVSADRSGQLQAWDEQGLKKWSTEAHSSSIEQLVFSPKGDTLFTFSEQQIGLWESASGEAIDQWTTKLSTITAATRSQKLLLLGDQSGQIIVYDLASGQQVMQKQVSEARIGTIAAHNNQVYLGTDAGELIRLSLDTVEPSVSTPFTFRNYRLIIDTLNEQVIACGRDQKQNLQFFDLNTLDAINSPVEFNVDKDSEAFRFGLRAMTMPTDTTFLIADYRQNIRVYDLKNDQWIETSFQGKAAGIYDLAVDRTGTQLAVATGHDVVKVMDLTGTKSHRMLHASNEGSRAVDFHPVNPVVAAYGIDEKIRVINVLSGQEIFQLKAKGEYSSTPINFDPTGKYVLRKSSEKDFDFYNFKNQSPRNLKVKNGRKYAFSPDGRRLVFLTPDGLSIYDPIKLEQIKEVSIKDVQDIAIANNGALAVLLRDDYTVLLFSDEFEKTDEFKLEESARSDKLYWSANDRYLIGIRNSVMRGEPAADFTIKVIDPESGKLEASLPGHDGFTNALVFANEKMLTGSIDGLVKIWDLTDLGQAHIGTLIPLQGEEYVVSTPEGLFDASPAAMDELHYVKSGKLIALEQMKSTFYEPNLLSKLMGFNDESVQASGNISKVSLYPELQLKHPLKNNGKLGINLNANDGGIGRVVIMINGKEVSSDVRGINETDRSAMEIDYDISNHPFLYSDKVNKVTIKAYNADGTLSSDEKSLYVFGEEKPQATPHLYAIIAGSSDYEGDALDLKYAAKDASDLANAVRLSSEQYLGPDRTHVTLLTTDQETSQWPTKENIRSAFEEYAGKATANDLLFVYLSGHGVNQSGENSDFYYLTCSAANGDMNNTVQRKNAAISSTEFTEYIKSVPALKQILVIDACHSGRLASSLAASRSAMSSTQIRALERMKDRTGLFVLAGSAADAVSYETTLFGQGLLTYSLLFGMKGAALREDGFVDVLQLFQFAANMVPELAEEIGGIQKPEIRVPEDGKSFDLGQLNAINREKIPIKAPKPVYVHSRFQDDSDIFDPLNISELMDEKLINLSKVKDAPLVFVDDKSFSGAIQVHGRYEESGDLLNARIKLVKGGEVKNTFTVEAVNANVLTEQIIERIVQSQ